MYTLRVLAGAVKDLKNLDKPVTRTVLSRLNWLAENFEVIERRALKGELMGFYKFRVGDYRVIYEVLDNEKTIIIHSIGHRREVYKKRR